MLQSVANDWNFAPTEGIVYGEIRDTSGRLRENAVVEVVTYRESCDAPGFVRQGGPKPAPDGRYRLLLRDAHFTEMRACLVVNASVETSTETLREHRPTG